MPEPRQSARSGEALTGRQIVMVRLGKAVGRATAGELARAVDFLEFAYEVRKGCQQQRRRARGRRRGGNSGLLL